MLRSTAIASIARRLGNRTNLDSAILTELQATQVTLEEDHAIRPWFLLTEIASATTTASEERVQLPTDFIGEYEYGTLYVYDSSAEDPWIELAKDDYDDLVAYHKGATGQPQSYALTGNYFRLFPTPDAAYTLKMLYYKKDTTLDSDIENQWLKYAPELLISETGKRMAAYIQNKISYAMFEAEAERALKRLLVQNTSREVTNSELDMGGG